MSSNVSNRSGLAMVAMGILSSLIGATSVAALEPSPTGLWRTIDDATGKPRAEISLRINNGVLEGRIVRSLVAGENPDAVCDKCPGPRKGQPIVGMAILTDLRQSPSDPLRWQSGQILDPDTGEVYSAEARLSGTGSELTLRGYIGISLFGRSQIWQRVR